MDLYEIVPEYLFSVLVSKNKRLYVNSIFVLLDAFKTHLQISKDALVSMLIAALENEIISADLSDEALLENEYSLSGRAHFIVRKLKTNGWITIETESDFIDYVTLPNYSIKIIQTLFDITHISEQENFTYVYSTYSSLKTANENREPFEVYAALCDSVVRTEQLVKNLKSVYHGITAYNQQLLDLINVNTVLNLHYDRFRQEIAEKILRPLKIRDSVPKYKRPIEIFLKSWLVDDDLLNALADFSFHNGKYDSVEQCHEDIQKKIYYIIDTYEHLERDYINVIDQKNRAYTRATTQKIDYLLNSDQSVKGNLISVMKAISEEETAEAVLEMIQDSFELYELGYLSEESLYDRKKAVRHERVYDVKIEDESEELSVKARAAAIKLLNSKYSQRNVQAYVEKLFDGRSEVRSTEVDVADDEAYIMTMLAVAYAGDRESGYTIEIDESSVKKGRYEIPDIIFRKKVRS